MKHTKTIKDFCEGMIKYLGSGYTNYKIVSIPSKKAHKSHEILKKVSNHYQTNLSRGKRQYRRKLGKANYSAVCFKNTIVVLRTSGTHEDGADEFKEFKKSLRVDLSEWLTLIFFINERKRLTVRLDRLTFRRIREDFFLAIKNGNGKDYNFLKRSWHNLPHYKGIGVQGSQLHHFIKGKLFQFGRNWKGLFSEKKKGEAKASS